MSYLPELPDYVPGSVLIVCLCLPTPDDGRKRLDDELQRHFGKREPKSKKIPGLEVVSVISCNGQTRLEIAQSDGY